MKTKKTASKKIIKNKIKKIKAVKKVIRKPIVQKKKVEKAKPVPKEIVIDAKKISDFEVLEKLLGDNNKVKLWKVFVLNTNKEFLLKDLIKLSRIKKDNLILELRELMRIGLVKANKKEHHIFYKTNKDFPLLSEITNLVLSVVPRSAEKVLEKLNTLNKLKTVLLSGFFTSKIGKQKQDFESFNSNSNIDLLLVFEKIPDNAENDGHPDRAQRIVHVVATDQAEHENQGQNVLFFHPQNDWKNIGAADHHEEEHDEAGYKIRHKHIGYHLVML